MTIINQSPIDEPYKGIKLFDDDGNKKNKSTILIEIGRKIVLFHDADKKVYADIPIKNHKETWPIKSSVFKNWLQGQYYKLTNSGVDNTSINDALNTLACIGLFDGNVKSVYTRVGELDGNIYIDLVNEEWHVLEVSKAGWRIVQQSPVKFIRKAGMTSLPYPDGVTTQYEGFDLLRRFLNVDVNNFMLIEAFIVNSFKLNGPYPILLLQGEQGTAKSTTSKLIRSLIDPSNTPLRQPPKDTNDLLIGAINNWCVTLDNMSGMSQELSDAMCRLSTGGGYSKRELYTDTDEILVNLQRPSIMNGIDDIATRPDFAERSLMITLQPISTNKRITEKELNESFEYYRPKIFNGIVCALVKALNNYEHVVLNEMPRMADFAKWAYGAALNGETFLQVYMDNQNDVIEAGIDSSPVGQAIVKFMSNKQEWKGTASELYEGLSICVEDEIKRSKSWPKQPNWLVNKMTRLSPSLRKVGIYLERFKKEITLKNANIAQFVPNNVYPHNLQHR